jgi:hypothetical protein
MEQSFKLFTARDKQIYKEQLKRKISSGVFLLLTVTVCLPNPIQILQKALHLGKRSELRKSQRRKPKRTPKTP